MKLLVSAILLVVVGGCPEASHPPRPLVIEPAPPPPSASVSPALVETVTPPPSPSQSTAAAAPDTAKQKERTQDEWRAFWDAHHKMSAVTERIAHDDLVFIGTVVSLGKEPGYWSGYAGAWQDVVFEVEALKGDHSDARATIAIQVVSGDRFARSDRPGLSPKVFAKGAKFLLGCLRAHDGELRGYDITTWNAKSEREVRAFVVATNPK